MDTFHIGDLAERRRDALVQFVLGQKTWSGAVPLVTPEDLYEYLMLDPQDSAQLQSTGLSSIVRCLQQHIQSAYSGMEPGYEDSHFDEEDLQEWYQILSQYGTWAGNQMLKDYAENYIVPQLRLKKTSLFKALENSLQQMRISTDSVHSGLQEYLQALQRTCDLEVLSAYIDGDNYQDAPYYFVGSERTPPHAYYWRKARVEVTNDSATLNPTAWGEWQPITMGATGKVLDLRPVYCAGRLMLVWCEWRERQLAEDGRVNVPWSLEIKVIYAGLNGQWSQAMTLHQRDCDDDVSNGRMTAVVFGGGDPRADRLAVCYTNRSSLTAVSVPNEIEIHETRDMLFRKVADERLTMLELTYARFKSPDIFQHKIFPADRSNIEITPTVESPGSITDQLSLEVIHTREMDESGSAWDTLRVRGRCDAVKETRRAIKTLSIGWQGRATAATPVFDIRIVDAGEDRLAITVTTSLTPTAALELKFGQEALHSFAVADFVETQTGSDVWVATLASKKMSVAQLLTLMSMTHEQILTGAGFSAPLLGATQANDTNYLTPKIFYAEVPFTLKFGARTEIDVPDWNAIGKLDGHFATPWLTYRRPAPLPPSVPALLFPVDQPIPFTFGVSSSAPEYGRNHYAVVLKAQSKLYTIPSLDNSNPDGAQFLSFNQRDQKLKYVRLNSKFGPVLVARAAVSTDAVLAWDTQHAEEPPLPDGTLEKNGPFDGCNGLFFWELFFHLPHLVATRLGTEGRYREAQGWYEYIFNPLAREIIESEEPEDPVVIPAPAYWRCRPLHIALDPAYEAFAPNDPDAIGYTAPVHMQIAIFMGYVRNLIEWGDGLYRQLSRDSMVAAKLCYVRALSLMGEQPDVRTTNAWSPTTLEELLKQIQGRDDLKAFEAAFDISLEQVPLGMATTPRLGLLGSGVFRAPVNEQLMAVWATLEQRLANLRNDRTIDGKPLSVPLFDAPVDPLDMLRAQGQGGGGAPRNPGGQVQVVPYRWRVMHDMALRCVQTLAEYGDQVRLCLEQRDRGQQEELQQSQLIELGGYARSVQEQTIAQLQEVEASLRQSEVMVKERANYYTLMAKEGVSEAEKALADKTKLAKSIGLAAGVARIYGSTLDLLPNTFGTAFGGFQLSAVPYAIGYGLQVAVDALLMEAEESATNEQYRRRQQEWEFAREQANLEAQTLDKQIEAQRHAINAARTSLQQTDLANAHAQQLFTFYKNRSTSQELYGWMLGQMKTLYFQLYDVVVGLCLNAETCWHYEMGDYRERFIRPDVWLDNYHGLTAAHSLKLDLLKMEAAYLKRNERRIELVKTISLKQLLEGGTVEDQKQWEDLLKGAIGTLTFTLGQKLFDQDYPGHYCRQLSSVALTLPAVMAPYQDARAVLMQVGSYTLTQPTIDSVAYFHAPPSADPLPPGVIQNVRSSQQIGVSRALEDNGIVLDFSTDRYLPFEGAGVVSTWELAFPRHEEPPQQALLHSLNDIILHVSYTVKDGGKDFAGLVEKLLKPVSR